MRTTTVVLLAIGASILALPSNASAVTCTITGTDQSETIRGTSRADVICARGGNDRIIAGGGNDVIYAGSGADTIYAGSGSDRILAGPGGDTVAGGYGPDVLLGGDGNDTLSGGPQSDSVDGGNGADNCLAYGISTDSEVAAPCEQWGYRLPGQPIDHAEAFRVTTSAEHSYGGNGYRHCLVSNCGVTTTAYCIVTPDNVVDNCVVSDGFSGGFFDLILTDFRTGDDCGYPEICGTPGQYPPGSWVISPSGRAFSPGMQLLAD